MYSFGVGGNGPAACAGGIPPAPAGTCACAVTATRSTANRSVGIFFISKPIRHAGVDVAAIVINRRVSARATVRIVIVQRNACLVGNGDLQPASIDVGEVGMGGG